MQIELGLEDRRLLLQGIWKELTHYQGIIDSNKGHAIALEHASNMQKKLWVLEEKMLGNHHLIGKGQGMYQFTNLVYVLYNSSNEIVCIYQNKQHAINDATMYKLKDWYILSKDFK